MLVKYLDIPDSANVFIVGDIHGCYSAFMEALRQMYFDPEKDVVLAVGDLVDRGPENERCITLINEPWFHTVRGNHENFCLEGATDYKVEIYHKMTNNGGGWLYKYPVEERLKLIEDFNNLPYMMEVNYRGGKYGLIHADVPYPDWDVLKEMLEHDDEWEDRKIKEHLIWARNVVNKSYYKVENVDYVFLGHTVLDRPKEVGNCIFIDTGAVFGGGRKLTVVKLKEFVDARKI